VSGNGNKREKRKKAKKIFSDTEVMAIGKSTQLKSQTKGRAGKVCENHLQHSADSSTELAPREDHRAEKQRNSMPIEEGLNRSEKGSS